MTYGELLVLLSLYIQEKEREGVYLSFFARKSLS
jgi:hypothetical protein